MMIKNIHMFFDCLYIIVFGVAVYFDEEIILVVGDIPYIFFLLAIVVLIVAIRIRVYRAG